MDFDEYVFRIDRFTPKTMPMSRLAEYLAQFAALLGNSERVHFQTLRKGSVQIVSQVESEAIPKVRERLQMLEAPDPTDEIRKPFESINVLLQSDNAIGSVKRGNVVIVKFPGRETPRSPQIGPFTQTTEIQGQLVRIGGRDKTAHGTLEDSEGRTWLVTMTRGQARDLAQLLYGSIVRLTGIGRWLRNSSGQWEMENLKLLSWERLNDETLRESITDLRRIEGAAWSTDSDPHGLLHKIRNGDEEVH